MMNRRLLTRAGCVSIHSSLSALGLLINRDFARLDMSGDDGFAHVLEPFTETYTDFALFASQVNNLEKFLRETLTGEKPHFVHVTGLPKDVRGPCRPLALFRVVEMFTSMNISILGVLSETTDMPIFREIYGALLREESAELRINQMFGPFQEHEGVHEEAYADVERRYFVTLQILQQLLKFTLSAIPRDPTA